MIGRKSSPSSLSHGGLEALGSAVFPKEAPGREVSDGPIFLPRHPHQKEERT